MEITEIARLFSTGQFSRIEGALAETAVWEIIGEQRIEGAAAVLKHGRAIEAYFSTVAHEFTVQAVHQCGNTVIVQGAGAVPQAGSGQPHAIFMLLMMRAN